VKLDFPGLYNYHFIGWLSPWPAGFYGRTWSVTNKKIKLTAMVKAAG
jgi:hypothetical protein